MLSKNMIVVKKAVETISKNAKVASIFVRKQSAWGADKIVKSPYQNVEIPNMTVNDYVWQNLDRWPERTVSVRDNIKIKSLKGPSSKLLLYVQTISRIFHRGERISQSKNTDT